MTSVKRKEKVIPKALEIIRSDQNGVRYSDLVRKIQEAFPEIPVNTIHGIVWNLDANFPNEVYKAARGLFRHASYRTASDEVAEKVPHPQKLEERVQEEDFYQPFADWLVNDLEEATKAIVLGGNKFKDKWGTPDVIGVNKAPDKYILKHPTEIVSAEIKLSSDGLITAFGQACSYKLFSHKTYIVIPKSSALEDIAKIDALCQIFGLGLILFNSEKADDPDFQIRVRANKHEPDMFYVNKYMKLVEDELFT